MQKNFNSGVDIYVRYLNNMLKYTRVSISHLDKMDSINSIVERACDLSDLLYMDDVLNLGESEFKFFEGHNYISDPLNHLDKVLASKDEGLRNRIIRNVGNLLDSNVNLGELFNRNDLVMEIVDTWEDSNEDDEDEVDEVSEELEDEGYGFSFELEDLEDDEFEDEDVGDLDEDDVSFELDDSDLDEDVDDGFSYELDEDDLEGYSSDEELVSDDDEDLEDGFSYDLDDDSNYVEFEDEEFEEDGFSYELDEEEIEDDVEEDEEEGFSFELDDLEEEEDEEEEGFSYDLDEDEFLDDEEEGFSYEPDDEDNGFSYDLDDEEEDLNTLSSNGVESTLKGVMPGQNGFSSFRENGLSGVNVKPEKDSNDMLAHFIVDASNRISGVYKKGKDLLKQMKVEEDEN